LLYGLNGVNGLQDYFDHRGSQTARHPILDAIRQLIVEANLSFFNSLSPRDEYCCRRLGSNCCPTQRQQQDCNEEQHTYQATQATPGLNNNLKNETTRLFKKIGQAFSLF
jgi:hypothetical protein